MGTYNKDSLLNEAGIYRITNTANSYFYIGSTTRSFRQRWKQWKADLSRGRGNKFLREDWRIYGAAAFTFEIVEVVNDAGSVLTREQHYIDTLKPRYNICPKAGNNKGVKYSQESKRRMSLAQSGCNNSMYGRPGPRKGMRQDRLCICGQPVKYKLKKNGNFSGYQKTCGNRDCIQRTHQEYYTSLKGKPAWNRGLSRT